MRYAAGLIAILLGCCFAAAHAQPPARPAAPPTCARPIATAIVIDDNVNASPWMKEQQRIFRLPSLANALVPLIEASRCFTLLDPDPVFAAVAGAPQPEMIIRARTLSLRPAEPSQGEKVDIAVRKYISSYFGGLEADAPPLKVAKVSVQVLCARQRRLAAEFVGEVKAGPTAAERNTELLVEAFQQALLDLPQSFAKAPWLCKE